MTDDAKGATAPGFQEEEITQADIPASFNEETGTYYFHSFLVEAACDGLSPEEQKLWLTHAYCRHWIHIEQVDFYIYHYGLESV